MIKSGKHGKYRSPQSRIAVARSKRDNVVSSWLIANYVIDLHRDAYTQGANFTHFARRRISVTVGERPGRFLQAGARTAADFRSYKFVGNVGEFDARNVGNVRHLYYM